MNLTTQDEQVACFRNVAAHLGPGGCLVIEVMAPELQRLPPGETIRAFTVTPEYLGFEEYGIATQMAYSHHYWVINGHVGTFSAPFRSVWPMELDLMAPLGRDEPARALGRLEPLAIHQQQPVGSGCRPAGDRHQMLRRTPGHQSGRRWR